MDMYYHDIIRNQRAEEKLGVKFVSIEELCQISDFVVMALPLNKETEKYFDQEKFNLMKPSAFFINNSRGPIVDEEALINALKENKIAGAGIDVFTQEPPAKDNPLFKLDNVVVTPHSAANTKNAMVGMAMVAEDIIRILEGKEPKYPANNPKK
jgi:phosphoglycerate dehydrogenase-like enzyme